MSPRYRSRYAPLLYPKDWILNRKLLISLRISGMADGVAGDPKWRPKLLISLRKLPRATALFPCLFPQSARDVLRPPTALILVRSRGHRNGCCPPQRRQSDLVDASSVCCPEAVANQVRDPNRHAAPRIEWKVLEAKGRVERTHVIV